MLVFRKILRTYLMDGPKTYTQRRLSVSARDMTGVRDDTNLWQ